MEEADKDWMMIRMVGGRGSVFLLVPAHQDSPGQRGVKRLLLLLPPPPIHYVGVLYTHWEVVFNMVEMHRNDGFLP